MLPLTPCLLLSDWAAAIRVAALDCAEEKNHELCSAYDVHFYPSFRVSARPWGLAARPPELEAPRARGLGFEVLSVWDVLPGARGAGAACAQSRRE